MDRTRKTKLFVAASAFAIGLLAPSAQATLQTITIGTATGNISGGPYATVTLDDHGTTGSVHVTITGLTGFGIVDTGSGDPLLFNLNGDPLLVIGVNVLNLTAGFGIEQPTGNQDGTGSWDYGITCSSGCAQSDGGFTGTLSFDVVIPGITDASFISTAASNNFRFASDICVQSSGAPGNGCSATGDAANGSSSSSSSSTSSSTGGPSGNGTVPEPSSTSLALLGVALLGGTLLRRRLVMRD